MITIDHIIAASTEFVYEEIGNVGATILRFAPMTRMNGRVWVHPTFAREATLEQMMKRASLIWRVTSLWNPGAWELVYQNAPAAVSRKLTP